MGSVCKSMAGGQGDGHIQPPVTSDRFSGIHQRIVQRMAHRLLGISYRSKIEFRCGAEQEYIKIALFGYLFVRSIRVAVGRNGGYDTAGLSIERIEIFLDRKSVV